IEDLPSFCESRLSGRQVWSDGGATPALGRSATRFVDQSIFKSTRLIQQGNDCTSVCEVVVAGGCGLRHVRVGIGPVLKIGVEAEPVAERGGAVGYPNLGMG